MSNFPSNALVKCNVGISCSAGLKAPFCEVWVIQRRITQVRLAGSLATSHKGVGRKGNVFRKNKQANPLSWVFTIPCVDPILIEWEVGRNFITALKELATESQKSLNIQVLKLTRSRRTSGTDCGAVCGSDVEKGRKGTTILGTMAVYNYVVMLGVGHKIHQ